MWSQARIWISGMAFFAMACGGMAGGHDAASAGELDPGDLPYSEAPPPPAVLAANEWTAIQRASGRPLVVYTDPGDIPRLELATDDHQRLPLEHTHVEAALTGFVAEVEVTQTYGNPHAKPIEAVYVFPLPETARSITCVW